MYRVTYNNNYGTWKESRSSHWMRSDQVVQEYLDNLSAKNKYAEDIKVLELAEVKDRFKMPQITVSTE